MFGGTRKNKPQTLSTGVWNQEDFGEHEKKLNLRDAFGEDVGCEPSLIVEVPVCLFSFSIVQPRLIRYDLNLGQKVNLWSRNQSKQKKRNVVSFSVPHTA